MFLLIRCILLSLMFLMKSTSLVLRWNRWNPTTYGNQGIMAISQTSMYSTIGSSADVGETVSVPSGLVAIFKPKNWTSSDIVSKVKGILLRGMQDRCPGKFKIKVGHGGTLDPLAEGVLVLGIGEGTKLMSTYLEGSKAYLAVAMLGDETDTLDNTGTIVETVDCSAINEKTLESALPQFQGDILQVPPMYSALKRDGRKLYELARQGIEVEREARNVTVYSLQLTSEFQEDLQGNKIRSLSLPSFGLSVSSSGGFYVRSLISDLARACGGRAHMTDLLRTKQGPFELADCISQQEWDFDTVCSRIVSTSTKAGLDPSTMKPAVTGLRKQLTIDTHHDSSIDNNRNSNSNSIPPIT